MAEYTEYQKKCFRRLRANMRIFKAGVNGLFADSASYIKNNEKSEATKNENNSKTA